MRAILADIERWQKEGKQTALATVVWSQGSTLRMPGAMMAMTPQGDISGSVSGGCVERAVIEESLEVNKSGQPKVVKFGGSEASEWEVGLVCGGSIQVLIETLAAPAWKAVYPELAQAVATRQVCALATGVNGTCAGGKLMWLAGGKLVGDLGDAGLNEQVAAHLAGMAQGEAKASLVEFGEQKVFCDCYRPTPRLVIVGAGHLSIPLATLAKAMGFYTIVVDARGAFATEERFPQVDELLVEWPQVALERLNLDERTYLACISHDEKMDNPALITALARPTGYIGALGSRKAHQKRREALIELGAAVQDLDRIHAPIGLDLGAKSPAEIALSILAEIVAVANRVKC